MTPRLLVAGLREPGQRLALDADQTHYALRVLRLRAGEALQLFDGEGGRWTARLASAHRTEATVELLSALPPCPESPLHLTLVQCLSAAERMDFTVEKAVELGVAAIVPVASARSVVRLDDARAARRLAHWQRLVVAASMQCGRDRLPRLAAPVALAQWLAHRDRSVPGWVLAPGATQTLAAGAAALPPGVMRAQLLVGPESGLAPEELAAAAAGGLQPCSLGPRVLRTETAALAAITVLQALRGDLGDVPAGAQPGDTPPDSV